MGDLGEGGGVEGPFGEAEGCCMGEEGGEEGGEGRRGGEVVDALGKDCVLGWFVWLFGMVGRGRTVVREIGTWIRARG